MAAKRKYATSIDDVVIKDECTNRKCKWQGVDSDKFRMEKNDGITTLICPKCGNNEFYGLIN